MTGDTPISEREREILRLVAMGATNQQIAQKLDISVNTVKVHLRNIFGKIGVASRTEATVYAIRQGLVEVPRAAPEESAAPVAVADLPLDVPLEPLAPAGPGDVWDERVAEPSPAVEVAAPARPPATRWWLLPVTGALALAVGVGGTYLARPQPDPPPATAPTAALEAAISRWQGRAGLPRPRGSFAVAAIDGRLYVVGGGEAGAPSAAVDRYDPANNVWVELTDKPTAASQVKAVAIGRFIYVPGGEGAGGEVLDVLEAYDPRSQQWERLPNLPAPRSRYALASLEGRLYLFGGWDGSRYCDEVFVYDPASRTWSEDEQRLPTPRRDGSAAAVEGRLYVFGGENEGGALRVNERYDPAADVGRRWESLAPLSQPVAQPASVGILNFVLLFDADRHAVMQYSPASDSWTMVDIPADVEVSSRAAFLGSSVFVFGASEGAEAVALNEYQPLYNIFLPSTSGNS
jgi:DNA-binding CsgD family transcriptional regulator/N-acetylneuraminic acid mutarotase